MSVQMYQEISFREWLRLGIKVFRIPVGFAVPPPWDVDKIRPTVEGERHPFYKAYRAAKFHYTDAFQWQWDPLSEEELMAESTADLPPDKGHEL